MNIMFIVGVVIAALMMVFGISFTDGGFVFSNIWYFLNAPSAIIVLGGTIASLLASFPPSEMKKVFQHMPIVMGKQKNDPIYYINVMTELSQEARKKGLLALEDQVSNFQDKFLRDSVMLIVDAMEPDKVREQLENELVNIEARHAVGWDIYDKGAAYAPGFGMLGTVISLVNMLKSMNFEEEGGASSLAQYMAVALITTFYGSLFANVICLPIGTQLRLAHAKEMLCKELIIEGIISIQAGENPRHINEKLMSFLTRQERDKHEGTEID